MSGAARSLDVLIADRFAVCQTCAMWGGRQRPKTCAMMAEPVTSRLRSADADCPDGRWMAAQVYDAEPAPQGRMVRDEGLAAARAAVCQECDDAADVAGVTACRHIGTWIEHGGQRRWSVSCCALRARQGDLASRCACPTEDRWSGVGSGSPN